MAQSNLSMQYSDFQRELGKFMGLGADATNYTDADSADLGTIIDSGYRTALYPPNLPGEPTPHRWSFLRVVSYLTTAGDIGDYAMPDDFEGMDGPIRFDGTSCGGSMQKTSIDHILDMRSAVTNGIPTMFALTPQQVDGTSTSRWKIMFWPTPMAAYRMVYRYTVAPRKLSSSEPWPLGNVGFSEMVLEAILAKAEERKYDTPGVHRQAFMERLVTAITKDRQEIEPDSYGYFGDPSTLSEGSEPRHWNTAYTTYNGVAG